MLEMKTSVPDREEIERVDPGCSDAVDVDVAT